MLDADVIERWADPLVDYCLAVKPGESIVVGAELEARVLVEACARRVIDRGATPLIRVELPGIAEYFLARASLNQLRRVEPVALYEAQTADARIRISAETRTQGLAGIDTERQAEVDRARKPIRRAASEKRWVLTQFPTRAYAEDAAMPLEAYEQYVVSAMFLDRPDPVAAWRDLGRRQSGLVEFMTGVRTVRIEAPGTDITLDVDGRTWINSDGRRNMPSGEIFTGPVETSANGRLHCSFPVCRGGHKVAGIVLEFADGLVVNARADQGEDYLQAMLELDPGARRLGELGLGLNEGSTLR